MTEDQQPRTAAQEGLDDRKALSLLTPVAMLLWDRAEEVNADLGAQIAELRDTVAAQTTLMNSRYNAQAAMIVSLKDRFAALESPASAPEDECTVCGGTGHTRVDCMGKASAPDANERLWTKVIDRMNSAASPATAHQEPPDAKPAEVILSIYSMCDIRAWDEVGGRMVEIFGDSQPSTTVYIKNDLRDDVANLILGRDGAR